MYLDTKKILRIQKRDGRIADFDINKITKAIFKAGVSTSSFYEEKAEELSKLVYDKIIKSSDPIPTVEKIQDIVEKVLIEQGHAETAKAYILYRNKRSELRNTKGFLDKIETVVNAYVSRKDWRVAENSNASYAISGLQAHISGAVISQYTLKNIYPNPISDAHKQGDFHIHDLSVGTFAGYSFYRNEVVIVRNKLTKIPLTLSLEQLYGLVDEQAMTENGFEIKYTSDYEILDENGWTNLRRVLRHKTTKPLISLNTFNGKNLMITNDHPFITLEDKKDVTKCPECKLQNIVKNRTNSIGKDYFKCKSCNHKFGLTKEALPDLKKRKEIFAEDLKLNNYALTPEINIEVNTKNNISSQDGWFIGMYIAEGYQKYKSLVFEMTDSPQLRKLVDYLSSSNIEFNLNYSASSGLQLLHEKSNILSIRLSALNLEMQSLISQIRPYAQNKNFPIALLNYKPNITGSMISGFVDGDGVVRNDDKWVSRVNLRVTSKTALSQIQFWLNTQQIKSSLASIDSYGDRKYGNLNIKSKKQLYSLTFYIPENKKEFFGECLKIDDNFKYSSQDPQFKSFSHFRKIEAIQNDDEYVYDVTTLTNTFICNGIASHNCAGWSLGQILNEGFNGVPGKVAAKPAKHFNAALGQIVNFFGTLQNEWAGAQAFSSFDTYLAPYVAKDNLTQKQVKQGMQEFIFGINQTSRWGNQVPFTNLTFDWTVPEDMKDKHIVHSGKVQNETYSLYQKEMDMINKAFLEIMIEGDMNGRIFTFPIPTYNITEDFNWNSENAQLLFEMTGKYGVPYFQNFINSTLKPGDVRSMCCRLQLDIRELKNKTGGLFGAGEQTGSIGVVTLNLPRLGYLSKSKVEFKNRLTLLLELAKESLVIKRKEVQKNMDQGLLPYSKRYLGNLKNHFSTIGVVGMNECCLNFIGKDISTEEGKKFAIEVLDFIRAKLEIFQEETKSIFNLEATPAEGTAYRLAKMDIEKYPDIITSGDLECFYTNSSHLPVSSTVDIFEALEHQDELQSKYSGGTVLHGFLGEKISDWKVVRDLVKKIAYNFKLPYFTLTPTFSICPVHGYLSGEHHSCPNEHSEEHLTQYGIEANKFEEVIKNGKNNTM